MALLRSLKFRRASGELETGVSQAEPSLHIEAIAPMGEVWRRWESNPCPQNIQPQTLHA